jgi:hypothetical protein
MVRHRPPADMALTRPRGDRLLTRTRKGELGVYFTDRGIEELAQRRGKERVSLEWLAWQLRDFVDGHPEFEVSIDRLATWLARADDEE